MVIDMSFAESPPCVLKIAEGSAEGAEGLVQAEPEKRPRRMDDGIERRQTASTEVVFTRRGAGGMTQDDSIAVRDRGAVRVEGTDDNR